MHIDHSEYTILLADDSVSNLEKMKSLLAGENFKLLPTLEADEVFLLAKLRRSEEHTSELQSLV